MRAFGTRRLAKKAKELGSTRSSSMTIADLTHSAGADNSAGGNESLYFISRYVRREKSRKRAASDETRAASRANGTADVLRIDLSVSSEALRFLVLSTLSASPTFRRGKRITPLPAARPPVGEE
jgi:hypothetical protein